MAGIVGERDIGRDVSTGFHEGPLRRMTEGEAEKEVLGLLRVLVVLTSDGRIPFAEV